MAPVVEAALVVQEDSTTDEAPVSNEGDDAISLSTLDTAVGSAAGSR